MGGDMFLCHDKSAFRDVAGGVDAGPYAIPTASRPQSHRPRTSAPQRQEATCLREPDLAIDPFLRPSAFHAFLPLTL